MSGFFTLAYDFACTTDRKINALAWVRVAAMLVIGALLGVAVFTATTTLYGDVERGNKRQTLCLTDVFNVQRAN